MGADSTAIILPPRRRAPAFHWAGIMPLRDGVARAEGEGRRGAGPGDPPSSPPGLPVCAVSFPSGPYR